MAAVRPFARRVILDSPSEIKCEEDQISVEEIIYEQKCRDVVDVICGGNKVENFEEEEDTEVGVLVKRLLPHFRHNCHEVKRQHCYGMPKVQEVQRPVDKCHVVTRVRCNPKTDAVKKIVCKAPEPVGALYPNPANPYRFII